MKKILILILFLWGISGISFAADIPDFFNTKYADTGQRSYKALIMGINYKDLIYSENDAKALAEVLQAKYGFQHINLLTGSENTTKEKLTHAVEALVKESREDDSVLIYFSGHGSLDKKTKDGWWIPSDAHNQNTDTWLSNIWLREQIGKMKARHVLLIADACYAGTVYPYVQLRGDEINDKFYRIMYNKKSRVAMTSAGSSEEASDRGVAKNSIFATFLLNGFQDNNKPYLCIQEL